MFNDLSENSIPSAKKLIEKINRSAKIIFEEAFADGTLEKCLTYEVGDIKGIMSVIMSEQYCVVQVSFNTEPVDQNYIFEIEKALQKVIDTRGSRDLYLNTNIYNEKLVEYFLQKGFVVDNKGFEYRYLKEKYASIPVTDSLLQKKGFELDLVNDYIDVLDQAFLELDRRCNIEPYGFRRNQERVIPWLAMLGQNQQFFAYWLNEELVGVVVLKQDILDFIALPPCFQGQGYGSWIIQNILHQLFEEDNVLALYLNVVIENEQAPRFYEKNGFEMIGQYCEMTYKPE